MSLVSWIGTLWDYNYWGNHRLLDCLETISEDDFTKQDDYSIGSIQHQLVHIMWAELVWYNRIHDQSRPTFTVEDYPSLESIRNQWEDFDNHWRQYLLSLTDDMLEEELHVTRQNGEAYVMSIQAIIHHIVNHGTNHRAQILHLIHVYGGRTFEQDMTAFFRHKQGIG